jgi:hypothetical protein
MFAKISKHFRKNENTKFFNQKNAVLGSRSWSRKDPHHLVRPGAVTRCGSGSDNGIKHG